MGKLKQEAGTAARFIAVGIVNTLVGCGIMFALYNLAGCSYWVSSAANCFFGSIVSFALNKKFTFRHEGDTVRSAARFAICIAVCYLLAYGIAKPLTLSVLDGWSLSARENTAMFIGMILFTGFNYLGQRFFAFGKKGRNNETEQ